MTTHKILVAYTTNAGTTTQAAQAVSEGLSSNGVQVEVRRLEEVTDLSPYTAVVIGAPMIMGWHRAATKFIKQHRDALSRVPVAYFFMARSLTQTGETQVEGVPLIIDPKLSQPPQQADRLSYRERYATVGNYLRPVLKATPQVKPVSAGFFGGRLDLHRLKLWQKLFVLFIIQAQPGGSINLQFIREWAANLCTTLLAGKVT
ncbi:menaquinone-dependent protoporphyrinogen oxidase [Thermoflexales bacterium]|nr:menaquinone-dependent protoporphyrinogen oxidase [Thermoflexales bacterium]